MPQVKVFGLRDVLKPIQTELSDAINECISIGLKFPSERRLQRFFLMDRDDFIYPAHERTERYTIVEITTFEGRSEDTKRGLVRLFYEKVPPVIGCERVDLDVIIYEIPRHAWGLMGEVGDEMSLSYKVEI
ncbi:MAG: tautomerase family protein [Pseudomonadota bacterium]